MCECVLYIHRFIPYSNMIETKTHTERERERVSVSLCKSYHANWHGHVINAFGPTSIFVFFSFSFSVLSIYATLSLCIYKLKLRENLFVCSHSMWHTLRGEKMSTNYWQMKKKKKKQHRELEIRSTKPTTNCKCKFCCCFFRSLRRRWRKRTRDHCLLK